MEHCWARDPLELAVLVTNRQALDLHKSHTTFLAHDVAKCVNH